jgi:phosphopantetheinyl transferase
MFDAFREDLHQQLRIFRDYVEKKQNQRAIEYILGEIQLIQLKKWILEQNFQYSQSTPIQSSRAHSHKYIGTIIGTSPIGLDIEDIGIHSNAFDNAYFSNQEFELAKRLIPPSYGGIEGIESILLWTLKEATFKIQRLEKIGQIKQIQIENYNNSLTGIDSKSKNKYNLHFSILHNSILAIATD